MSFADLSVDDSVLPGSTAQVPRRQSCSQINGWGCGCGAHATVATNASTALSARRSQEEKGALRPSFARSRTLGYSRS